MVFILAASEQSVLSSGAPTPTRIRLRDLIAQGLPANSHVELVDVYFGKNYIYAAKLVQFQEVYVPAFPDGAAESGANLQSLILIRNDRHSSQRLIQSQQDLDHFVNEFNHHRGRSAAYCKNPSNVCGS